ncbi:hypothetical protein [Kingella kingae]|uniref:COG4648 family protein n=1 Tax=Kingella kingae TaxID=504 RepID=UPI00254CCD6F|nr:hypothetical protein [Kingella kingae]MDK4573905.1 hypothetical protein [Kingella kingae]MDK4606024.1 hypothetical protein [Kingella kingae]
MKIALSIVLGVASVAYPLLWYFGREQGWFNWLAGAMLLLWLVRAATQKTAWQRGVACLVALFFVCVLIFRQPESMYWYPVWVNVLMLLAFGGSLFAKQSLVERLARLQTPDLPPSGVAYTRKVTQIWCVFFVLNGSTAAVLALLGWHDIWAIYTGIVAYGLMGLLMSGEFLYRKLILKV